MPSTPFILNSNTQISCVHSLNRGIYYQMFLNKNWLEIICKLTLSLNWAIYVIVFQFTVQLASFLAGHSILSNSIIAMKWFAIRQLLIQEFAIWHIFWWTLNSFLHKKKRLIKWRWRHTGWKSANQFVWTLLEFARPVASCCL